MRNEKMRKRENAINEKMRKSQYLSPPQDLLRRTSYPLVTRSTRMQPTRSAAMWGAAGMTFGAHTGGLGGAALGACHSLGYVPAGRLTCGAATTAAIVAPPLSGIFFQQVRRKGQGPPSIRIVFFWLAIGPWYLRQLLLHLHKAYCYYCKFPQGAEAAGFLCAASDLPPCYSA